MLSRLIAGAYGAVIHIIIVVQRRPHIIIFQRKKIGQPWLAMAGGMFFYMTPKPPYPSMHDLVLGNFVLLF